MSGIGGIPVGSRPGGSQMSHIGCSSTASAKTRKGGPVMSRFQKMLPLVVPGAVGLILAAVTWLTVGVVVHAQAESRRREMRYALVSYLTLVALHRAAGQAMG